MDCLAVVAKKRLPFKESAAVMDWLQGILLAHDELENGGLKDA